MKSWYILIPLNGNWGGETLQFLSLIIAAQSLYFLKAIMVVFFWGGGLLMNLQQLLQWNLEPAPKKKIWLAPN